MFRLTAPATALVMLAVAAPAPAAERARTYQLDGVRTAIDRAAVAASGAAIVEVDHAYVVVTATPREIRFLTRRGYRAHRLKPPPRRRPPGVRARASAFPPADSGYHDYAEMMAAISDATAAFPSLVTTGSVATSYQGRAIPWVKISDNP